MMLTALLIAAPLAAITPQPVDGVTSPDVVEKMVRSNVSSMVAEEAVAEPTGAQVIIPAADNAELSFIDLYFPFSLDDGLNPKIEEEKVVLWIVTALVWELAGPLWIPKALTDLEPDDEYQEEAIINWLIHLAIFAVATVTIYVFFIGVVLHAVNSLYLMPVATINSFNRHVSGGGKKKKGGGKSAVKDLPGMPAMAQLESAAVVAY